ncbi:MAG: hypothetical protein WCV73_02850 [Patescibacteria group bacterium]|jgi:hypothetical protein
MEKLINFFKNSQPSQYFLSGLIVVLLITNVVTIVILQKNSKQIIKRTDNKIKVIDDSYQNINQDDLNNVNQGGEYQEPVKTEVVKDNTAGEITVEWYDLPFKTDAASIFMEPLNLSFTEVKNKIEGVEEFTAYKVGVVKQGPYLGKEIMLFYGYQGMGGAPLYRLIRADDKVVVLGKYSEQWLENFNGLVVLNENITISNLETPQRISIPNSNHTLTKMESDSPVLMLNLYEVPEKLFKYNGSEYVYWGNNCYFVKAGDGTIRKYRVNFDFFGISEGSSDRISDAKPQLLNFNWLDGTKNKFEYSYYGSGCGDFGPCYRYVDFITNLNQLSKIATATNGEFLYELKNDVKESSYDGKDYYFLQSKYDSYYPGYDAETNKAKEKMSFADYLKQHPVLFWADPFGRYVEFQRAEFMPAVECGKPVIYLYPEKTMDVSVWVNPTGGFTKTEPAYNHGWKVLAKPSGELYNYSDNKTYPYLFWEGIGLNYERPQEGFVVKKEEVKSFLENKLAQAGLIKHEYDEFIAFWLPKMQVDPYYFITFVPQEQFNLMAPLKVLPQPTTVIRVFMDYEGLTSPIKVKPQIINTPVRKGFTVVEWGGQLRH